MQFMKTRGSFTRILSQIKAVRATPHYFFKIRFKVYTLMFVRTGMFGDDFGHNTPQQSWRHNRRNSLVWSM